MFYIFHFLSHLLYFCYWIIRNFKKCFSGKWVFVVVVGEKVNRMRRWGQEDGQIHKMPKRSLDGKKAEVGTIRCISVFNSADHQILKNRVRKVRLRSRTWSGLIGPVLIPPINIAFFSRKENIAGRGRSVSARFPFGRPPSAVLLFSHQNASRNARSSSCWC